MRSSRYHKVALCLLLFFSTRAFAHTEPLLVTQQKIGQLTLGMTKATVVKLVGHPRKIQSEHCFPDDATKVEHLVWQDLQIALVDNKVVRITTTSPTAATSEGYTIGTPISKLNGVEFAACNGESYYRGISLGVASPHDPITSFTVGRASACSDDCRD